MFKLGTKRNVDFFRLLFPGIAKHLQFYTSKSPRCCVSILAFAPGLFLKLAIWETRI